MNASDSFTSMRLKLPNVSNRVTRIARKSSPYLAHSRWLLPSRYLSVAVYFISRVILVLNYVCRIQNICVCRFFGAHFLSSGCILVKTYAMSLMNAKIAPMHTGRIAKIGRNLRCASVYIIQTRAAQACVSSPTTQAVQKRSPSNARSTSSTIPIV